MEVKFTRMKFNVESKAHSADIQKALFRRGIGWAEALPQDTMVIRHDGAPFLYVDEDRKIRHGHSHDVFTEDMATEYVYRLALVEPRQPGQPLQSVPMPVFHIEAQKLVGGGDLADVDRIDCRGLKAESVLSPSREEVQDKLLRFARGFNDAIGTLVEPPLGLKPWQLVLEDRKEQIRDAINRYIHADIEIPVIWWTELNDVTGKIRKLEKIA